MPDDTIGIEIIGLKKLELLQDSFVKKIDNIYNKYAKAMQAAGTVGGKGGTSLSNKLVIIGETQIQLQRMMAARLGQITINTANKYQQAMMVKQQKVFESLIKISKTWDSASGGEGKSLQKRMWDGFKGLLKGMFSGLKGILGYIRKAWDKTAGAIFKKTGQMGMNKLLGLGGATILGALVGKMIASSPLLQAMFKIMNTSLTLILRPIGDFFGSFLRPMSIYFLKEIAIPFFMKNKKMMEMGEQWGRTALGFFINPGKAIQSAIILGLKDVPFFAAFGTDKAAVAEANLFQKDPGMWKRWTTQQINPETGRMEGVPDIKGDATLSPAAWGTLGDPDYIAEGMGGLTYREWQSMFQGPVLDEEGKPTGDMTGEGTAVGPTLIDEILMFFGPVGILGRVIKDWWNEIEWDKVLDPLPMIDASEEGGEQITQATNDWAVAWDNFADSITKGANNMGRRFDEAWSSVQEGIGGWVSQIQKDTSSWLDWAGEGIAQGWEWIANFGKVNEAFADTGKDSEEAQTSLVDGFWSWVESIKVAIFGTRVATDAFAATIITAGDKITTAADIATGGIFQGSGHGRPLAEGTGEKPWDPLTGLLNLVTGQDNPPGTVLGGIFGDPTKGPLYSTPKADDVGYSSKLGEYSDTRFESSPGKFVDIYSKGEKVDPSSAEGKTIQGIYQTQYDTKIANQKQQATMAAVKEKVTTADAGKAYILAGGGEAGLAAVEFAKAEGLNFAKYADIVALADKFGLTDHPMIKTAKEGLAKKIAMAKKIMQSRIDAGQTPSIQGDMLELFPDAEDSAFGWSDDRLADFDAANQARYISMASAVTGSGTAITSAGTYNPSTGYVGDVGGLPSWLGGGTVSSIGPGPSTGPGPGGYGGGNPGGRGPGGKGPGGGPKGGGGGGTKGPGGGKGGTGGRKGNSGGGASSSSGGGTTSGKKGTGKKGKSGQGRRQFWF